MDQYLTTAQVADTAGRSIRTLSRWRKDGILRPSLKLPGQTGAYLFDAKHVAEVIEQQRGKADNREAEAA